MPEQDEATAEQDRPMAEQGDALRRRLALALDFDDQVAALRLAEELRPFFGVAKVGLELYSAAGPESLGALVEVGYEVFVDLKLHDIPTTVGRAARVLGSLGASYVTAHAAGGAAMLRSAVEGLAEGAAGAGLPAPRLLAVTVLTSEPLVAPERLSAALAAAVEAGCGGFVCASPEVEGAKRLAPGLLAVVPGIRPEGAPSHDQARAATAARALAAGADLLVVGRAVTAAADPPAAAAALSAEVAGAIR